MFNMLLGATVHGTTASVGKERAVHRTLHQPMVKGVFVDFLSWHALSAEGDGNNDIYCVHLGVFVSLNVCILHKVCHRLDSSV